MQRRVYGIVIAIAVVAVGAYKFKIYAAHEHDPAVRPLHFSKAQLLKDLAATRKLNYEKDPKASLSLYNSVRNQLETLKVKKPEIKSDIFSHVEGGNRLLKSLINRVGFGAYAEVDIAILMRAIELMLEAGDQFTEDELAAFIEHALYAPEAAKRVLGQCDYQEVCGKAKSEIEERFEYIKKLKNQPEPHYKLILEYLNKPTLGEIKELVPVLKELRD